MKNTHDTGRCGNRSQHPQVVCGSQVPSADRIAQLYLDESLNRAAGQRARSTIEQRYAEEAAGKVFLDVWDRLLRKVGKA